MRTRHPLEWSVVGASVIALALLVGALVYDGVTGEVDPRIEVTLAAPVRQEDHWVIPLALTNRGGITASNVDVEVTLSAGGRELETSTVTLPFVPEGSEVDAAVVFTENPAGRTLQPRVLGYELP